MEKLTFRPTLPSSYFEALEHLVFFNRHQYRVRSAILEALDRYGSPEIVRDGDALRVTVTARRDAQCLFALSSDGDRPKLLGMMIFLRTDVETLLVVYLSVAEDSCRKGERPPGSVVFAFVEEIRSIARRLRGVRRVTLMHPHGGEFHIRVHGRQPSIGPNPAYAEAC